MVSLPSSVQSPDAHHVPVQPSPTAVHVGDGWDSAISFGVLGRLLEPLHKVQR